MPQIDVQGLRIAYVRVGTGPPLVLVHGFVGDGKSTWLHQIDELSDEFTVVAWDGPGAGRSADPPASFRMKDYADCLAGFVDELGFPRAHIAGLSFGGAVALEVCRRHPRRPLSLVLAGAYAGWAGSLPPAAVEERLAMSLRAADLPPAEFVAMLLPSMFSTSAPQDRVLRFAASVAKSTPTGSGQWPARPPRRTCATCSPASTCQPCSCPGTRTYALR